MLRLAKAVESDALKVVIEHLKQPFLYARFYGESGDSTTIEDGSSSDTGNGVIPNFDSFGRVVPFGGDASNIDIDLNNNFNLPGGTST